jgi:hypothetical protein
MEIPVIKYPSVEALSKVVQFFDESKPWVRIEEKIDGSNVSIRFDDGQLVLQSRTQIIDQSAPTMFKKFVDWAVANVDKFDHDRIYYGEMVGNGKLRYPDAPPFLLFDVYHRKHDEWVMLLDGHEWLGIPVVKALYEGPWQSYEHVQSFMGKSSYADVEAEGVVVKAFNVPCWYINRASGERVDYIDKMLAGKLVRESYQETKAPKTKLDSQPDPLYAIAEALVTEARIQKAAQRLQEEGRYDPSKPHTLIPIVAQDVAKEDFEYVKELLFSAYWKPLSRNIAKVVVNLVNEGV